MRRANIATIKTYVAKRDKAIERAILNDDWDDIRDLCVEYMIPIKQSDDAFKVWVCKNASGIMSLSDEVRNLAVEKSILFGGNDGKD